MRTMTGVLVTVWVLVGGPSSVVAWDDTGHQVVALIAWENLSESVRKKAVAIMLEAPGDANLASMLPSDNRPLATRERELFLRASTWPDVARDFPKYHRKLRHYRDFFWKWEGGQVVNVTDKPDPGDLLKDLPLLKSSMASTDPAQAGERAISLAWILHLLGDIHQPLHCSARVTTAEPNGDGGGNLFKLEPVAPGSTKRNNLHQYWDSGVEKGVPRKTNESTSAQLARAANKAMQAHPKASVGDLKPGQFEAWCRESVTVAQVIAYPPELKRNRHPPASYGVLVGTVSLERAAVGGYRLAALLEELLGQ